MRPTLYLITPPTPAVDFSKTIPPLLPYISHFQVRLKPSTNQERLKMLEFLTPHCAAHNVCLVIDDEVSLAPFANGVHLGEKDMPIKEARALLPNHILGASCYNNLDRADKMVESGADYVAFGAVHPTTTKQNATRVDIETIRQWCTTRSTPTVAIGGITVDNCRPILDAGVSMLAVCRGVWEHPAGALAAVQRFKELLS
jgi:thiamine-phosphate pyrophosphorylase